MRFHILALAVTLAVLGCSGNPGRQATSPPAEPAPPPGDPPGTVAGESELVPERPFPDASLYALLVAEFALRRRDYDLALQQYMEQASRLRDKGVSAHATRLAQFMHRNQEALRASRLWVELDPENLEARLTLANLLARYGHSREALPHMEVILRAGGLANFTALARGFRELSPEQRRDFLARIQTLLAEYPRNTQLRICQVLMLEELGRTEEALAELQPVFDTYPEQLQAVVLDAKLRLDLGMTEDVYRRILPVLEAQPDNHRLRMQYARLLTRTDLEEAERQFRLLVEQTPEDPDLLFSLALVQRETDDLEGARASLRKLLELDARTDEAHYYLGKTAEEQQRREDALTHYMQVQPGRDFGAATERIAQLLLAAGRSVELGTYFDHLRKRYPQLGERLYTIEADRLMAHQHAAEALQLLDRGLADFPRSIDLRYSRSMLYERQGNLVLAEEDLRSILLREPDNATALNALGYTLANRTDRYREAQELIGRALAISPNEPAILDSMGWVKYRLGEYGEALEYLQQAYSAFPDPEVAAHLGEVLWIMGDAKGARTVWDQALEKNPEHEIILEAMQRLGATPAEE